jgi:membrane protease YdiL (CAAX protease family)
MRLRATAGILVGVAALALAAPPTWVPWGAWVRTLLPGPWWLPGIALALLATAASLLPPPDQPARHHPRTVALGLGVLLVLEPLLHLAVLAYLAGNAAPGGEDLLLPLRPTGSAGPMLLRAAFVVLLAPIVEEWCFRGRLLPWLARHLGPASALSITTLAFACAHGHPLTILMAVPVGLLLGWLRLARGDLGACVLVHQAHNGLFLLAGPALVTNPLVALVLAVAGAALIGLALWQPQRRAVAGCTALAVAAVAALAIPLLARAQDALWTRGVARLAAKPRTDPHLLLDRLAGQQRRGLLTQRRRVLLRVALERVDTPAADLAGLFVGSSGSTDPIGHLRLALASAQPPPDLVAAVRALARDEPAAFAQAACETPEALPLFFDFPAAVAQLRASEGPERRRLLAACERAWPGRSASLVLALDATERTPIDVRHLRLNQP